MPVQFAGPLLVFLAFCLLMAVAIWTITTMRPLWARQVQITERDAMLRLYVARTEAERERAERRERTEQRREALALERERVQVERERVQVDREATVRPPIADLDPMPQSILDWALNESSLWAQEDVKKRARELYAETRDWERVRAILMNERAGTAQGATSTFDSLGV